MLISFPFIKSRRVNVNFISCFFIRIGFELVVNQRRGEHAWLPTHRREHVSRSAVAVGFDSHDQLAILAGCMDFNAVQQEQTVLYLSLNLGSGVDTSTLEMFLSCS